MSVIENNTRIRHHNNGIEPAKCQNKQAHSIE